MKSVWIVHQYGSTPEYGSGGRHDVFARYLSKRGYSVSIFASASHHLLHTTPKFEGRFWEDFSRGYRMVWIRSLRYKNAHSLARVVGWVIFSVRTLFVGLGSNVAPSVIVCSSPGLFPFLSAKFLAKRFNCPLVFEVRDIWPLTLTELGGISRANILVQVLQWIEDKAYRDADMVISNLENAAEHMISRGMDPRKFRWIPNGVEVDQFSKQVPPPDSGIAIRSKSGFIVGYLGTVGRANALMTLIDAAAILSDEADITFSIVGDGKDRADLEAFVQSRGLTNVVFHGSVNKEKVGDWLARFDVAYLGTLNSDIYRFGIASIKMAEYMLAGVPVLHCYGGCGSPILAAHAGLLIEPDRPDKLADGILSLKNAGDEVLMEMGTRGIQYAKMRYDYGKLSADFEVALSESMVCSTSRN